MSAGGPAATAGTLAAEEILRSTARLERAGAHALRSLDDVRLAAAFAGAVGAFRDPGSPERRRLDPDLARSTGLSRACLDESLAALLEGFSTDEIAATIARGRRLGLGRGARAPAPHLVVLPPAVPGLVVQPLLASLAAGRPLLVKSSRREPSFAPAFAAALAAREPALGDALACLSWGGGDREIEDRLFAAIDRVVAYGGADALGSLRARLGERLIAFGPKASVAIVSREAARGDLGALAAALARDVALFEQRGCLSLQALYTDGDARALADALAAALVEAAERWPPAPLGAELAGALRSLREVASFLGSTVAATPLASATVIVDHDPRFRPAPGGRALRVHRVPELTQALEALRPAAGLLQGVVLAGEGAAALGSRLRELGVSYLCAAGRLQSPPATWANGGTDLVAELT